MHSMTEKEIIHDFTRLKEAFNDDILITKKDKPYVVVMDYTKYKELESSALQEWSYWNDNEIDNFGKISLGLSKNNFDDEDEDYSQW